MDINPQGPSNPMELTRVGDQVFFVADDGVHGTELWKSDGTPAGTVMVKDIRPGTRSSGPAWLTAVGTELFFVATDGNKHKTQLWKSDGTEAGTVRVSNIINYDYVGPYGLDVEVPPVAVGSQLFFFNTYCCVRGANLYVSDGTPAGTHIVNGGDTILTTPDSDSAAFNGKLYFANYSVDNDPFGTVVWVSDGTEAGTHPLAGSPTAEEVAILPVSGQNLYFIAGDWEGPLWMTDGTAAGTRLLTSTGAFVSAREAAYLARRLYFGTSALWKTDGTSAGTQPISDGDVYFLTAAGGHLYFARAGHLWISDGTPSGTHDLVGFGTLWPRQIVAVGNETCFAVQDWDAKTWQLWESDGSLAGSYSVKSFVNPDMEAEGPLGAAVGSRLFFAADDGVHGAELWSYTP
jgi:ELWxxDGT repeat protein